MKLNFQEFLKLVRELLPGMFPGLKIEISKPYHPTGIWVIDIFLDNYHLSVQFKENHGYGLYSGDDDWNNSVDEEILDARETMLRIFGLLSAKGHTIPTTNLQGLRANKTQREVAEAMHIKQPSYAKMERDGLKKMQVATLQKMVSAMNAKLYIFVQSGDGHYYNLDLPDRKNDEFPVIHQSLLGVTYNIPKNWISSKNKEHSCLKFWNNVILNYPESQHDTKNVVAIHKGRIQDLGRISTYDYFQRAENYCEGIKNKYDASPSVGRSKSPDFSMKPSLSLVK